MSTTHETNNVLGDRDVNAMIDVDANNAVQGGKGEIKSMEYHRQMLQNKLNNESEDKTYISPSDNLMSPTTAKLSAYRNKNIMKGTKGKSLFAKTSSKNLESSGNLFGDKPASQ